MPMALDMVTDDIDYIFENIIVPFFFPHGSWSMISNKILSKPIDILLRIKN